MRLQEIQQGNKLTKKKKRVGRGIGSGAGAKSGRGQKGQKSRTGAKIRAAFEGGQTPFVQKIPKLKGFKRTMKVAYQVVNLKDLQDRFDDGATVNIQTLYEKRLISKMKQPVKILATGKLEKKLTVDVDNVSAAASKAIEKAGGSINSKEKKA